MDDQTFSAAVAKQRAIADEAYKMIQWIPSPLKLEDKAARFKGFRQRTVRYKAGEVVVSGGLPLPSDLVMHESVPMVLPDGTKLYSDIFLPATSGDSLDKPLSTVPALISWSPYSKQGGMSTLDDFPGRAGVPRNWTSGLEKWEAPDPAYWCDHGYAIINPDTRGAYTSDGDFVWFGHKEAQDGADFVTWTSEQPWCNGKVALTGNSWLCIAQWGIASLRPKGLAAIAPWEGFHDTFRQHMFPGGVPAPGFGADVASKWVSQGRVEDMVGYARKNGDLMDTYWEDKCTHPERINVPTYTVASWTNPVHTPGTFSGFNLIPDDVPKWLRIHNTMEWPDFYNQDSRADLTRFLDYYLLDKKDNGWNLTPKVRVSVLNMGLRTHRDIVNRPETSFPLKRQKHVKYYLHPNKELSLAPAQSGVVSYDSANGKAVFEIVIPKEAETTGFFSAHLLVSTDSHDEMDVFVQVEQLSSRKARQGTLCIPVQSMPVRMLMKLAHDYQIGLSQLGMAFHWGPFGCFRASHAVSKVDKLSAPGQPYHRHDRKEPLQRGKIHAIDVPLRPYGMMWEAGTILRLTIAGKLVIPFPIPGLEEPTTNNLGQHNLHCADPITGDSSYLLVPHI